MQNGHFWIVQNCINAREISEKRRILVPFFRFVMTYVEKKGKLSKDSFLRLYLGNETDLNWIDKAIKNNPNCRDQLAAARISLRHSTKMIKRVVDRTSMEVSEIKDINKIFSITNI